MPECSYPGYVLLGSNPYRNGIPSDRAALDDIARAARRNRLAVVVGIARTQADGTLRNEAVFLNSKGEEIGTYAKMRLWNFDKRWFRAGNSLPVFRTEFGTIGMMICADGRNPEIARTLAAQGAWLIADPTAWVGFGPTHDRIYNVQAEFMLRVRALENGVWIAAADKCGSELGSVHYAGRSQIAAPDGRLVATTQSAEPQIIAAELQKKKPAPFVARLSPADLKMLRHTAFANGSSAPPKLWIAVYQSAAGKRDDPLALKALAVQSAAAVIRTGQTAAGIARALRRVRGMRSCVLQRGEMVAPEPARAAALGGADLIVWLSPTPNVPTLEISRTRAVENRVFVLLGSRCDAAVPACLIAPDGSVVGSAISTEPSGFVAAIDVIAARRKEVVPGTQTFADRVPNVYRWLDRARGVVTA